jgi:hypothetical protein
VGTVAYIACWVLWIFGVFLGHEVLYSYYRRFASVSSVRLTDILKNNTYRFPLLASRSSSHPSHLPILPGLQLCRYIALQPLLLPPAYSLLGISLCQLERDVLKETYDFHVQNLPTIVTLLSRAGLGLALLLSFFSPEDLPGELSLSNVDQSIARRDGTFFDKNMGARPFCRKLLMTKPHVLQSPLPVPY